jgi:hypothetical protein
MACTSALTGMSSTSRWRIKLFRASDTAVLKGIEDAKSRGKKLEELHVGYKIAVDPRCCEVVALDTVCACLRVVHNIQAIIMELDRKHLRSGSRHDNWWRDQVLLCSFDVKYLDACQALSGFLHTWSLSPCLKPSDIAAGTSAGRQGCALGYAGVTFCVAACALPGR